eukprot:363329-Chlamydomonas_euryale.AAC.10
MPMDGCQRPRCCCDRQNKSRPAVIQMLSVVENARLHPSLLKDAHDRCFRKRADGKYVCLLCTTVFA